MLSWTFYKVWTGFSDKLPGCLRMDHQEGHGDSELKLSAADDLHLRKKITQYPQKVTPWRLKGTISREY